MIVQHRDQPRARCFECHRAAPRCICGLLTPIENKTDVVIVQHRREHLHPFGTARLVERGLVRSEVRVLWHLDRRNLNFGFADGAVLLFPGPDATLLGDTAVDPPSQLVILDGTWHQARALLRDHSQLRSLPRVALRPVSPSRYRIRREPQPNFISTVEATVAALRVLEPELRGLDALLNAFHTMIDWQLASRTKGAPRYLQRETGRRAPLPRALRSPSQPIALVYAESTSPNLRLGARRHRELFQVCATVHGTTVAHEQFFVGSSPPSPAHLAHMGIGRDALDRALPLADAAGWLRQILPTPCTVVTWNQGTLALLAPHLPGGNPIALKGVFCNTVGRSPGVLEALVEELQLPLPPAPGVHGRAALRLAACDAVLGALCAGSQKVQ